MSWQATAWVDALDYDAVAALPFRILLKLANVADENGQRAFIAKSTMAEQLGISVRSVQRALRDLENQRLVVRGDQRLVQHLRADKRPTVYDLTMRSASAVPLMLEDWYDGETRLSTEAPSDGETGLSTGETAAVASGETTAVARTTHRTNHLRPLPKATTERPVESAIAVCGHTSIDGRCELGCSRWWAEVRAHA